MIWWDKRFLSLVNLNLADCYLYLRYIDDQNMAMRPLAPGTRWQVGPWADGLGGKMVVIEQLVQSDELLPADMRTMEGTVSVKSFNLKKTFRASTMTRNYPF